MHAFLPEALVAPLRLASNPTLLSEIFSEPVLFAAHYATLADAIEWPPAVEAARQAIQARYARHDEVLDLIEKLRRQVAEGLELRPRLALEEYQALCAARYEKARSALDTARDFGEDLPSGRIRRLARVLEFSPVETQVLTQAFLQTLYPALHLLTRLFVERAACRPLFWKTLLESPSAEDLARALSSGSRLAASGLVGFAEGMPTLSSFWASALLKTDSDLQGLLVEPLVLKESPGGAARLGSEERAIILALLKQSAPGINVLLYGKPAVDKTRLAHELVLEAGATPYGLVEDIPEADRPAAVLVAQRLLNGNPEARAVLVVAQSGSILSRAEPEGFAAFWLGDEAEETKSLDERLLAETPIPVLWLSHDPARLRAETLTRFLFHTEALKGTRAERTALIESLIKTLPVGEEERAALSRLEGLSAQQIVSARSLATLTAGRSRKAYARHLLLGATRSQRALARRNRDEVRTPVTRYRLEYIHSAGRFGPAQILQALTHRPRGSLCLYGLPGTGKTQFAEHLAGALGKPLLVKRASDVFQKYLGESEKELARMFDQAEEEDALLLLDEADSFLRERSRSVQHWEVSTVNELLQRMERFEGVFVCTTNLYAQLDAAALRRFTFKLEFLPLSELQRWGMFLDESEVKEEGLSAARRAAFEERLMLMRDLMAGDFATVKRQCLLLGEELTPEEWLEQLEIEVRAKARPEASGGGLQATGG